MQMVEVELDGKKVEVPPGSMVMHAAEKAGAFVPHFCYHKKLSIAANCRMCLVDVEKAPKPMPACATPVTQGMIVRTKSDKAIKAQQSVMEFLLINHPLDCPICDQGGECQLQDLAVGYGGSSSRYEEEKRVVASKDIGPLISMEEMSRCIHCTRCVRFGQEIAGAMELGMSHRGEHSEIETFLGESVDSELSGNMIDLCPVGALTSKPFRYSARTWEMSRRKSVSPHDSTGANLTVQVKNHRVMRVLPLENEAVNECWIADRDRFSYEALNAADRLTKPMLKQGGEWVEVDWSVALEYVANGLNDVRQQSGSHAIGALVSPHATLEELYLSGALIRGLGSQSIDSRLRHAEASPAKNRTRWLGRSIASLSLLDRVLVVGSNVRKEHPLFGQRLRQAAKRGAKVCSIRASADDWAIPISADWNIGFDGWVGALLSVAGAVAQVKGVKPLADVVADARAEKIAESLLSGSDKAILLGNAVAHHEKSESLLYICNWLATQTGATVGFLGEAANTVGSQLVGAIPGPGGLSAADMLSGKAGALLLLNAEPALDTAAGLASISGVAKSRMVVTLSPFKTNLACSDVLLPISPFTETAGSFVNAEGRLQSFHAVVKPLGETRPAWKVLRALGEMLGVSGFSQNSVEDVLRVALPGVASGACVAANQLSNEADAPSDWSEGTTQPVVADIYQLDGLVRRSASLQATVDGKRSIKGVVA